MTAKEKNRLYMLQAVNRTLKAYQSVWEQAPEMLKLQEQLKAFEEESIQLFSQKQMLKQPFTPVKEANWQLFVEKVSRVAGLLRMHAHSTQNTKLFTSLHFNESDLFRASGQSVLAYAYALDHALKEHRGEMEEHSMLNELFDSFRQDVEGFQDQALEPSDRKRILGETTKKIAALQREVRLYLLNIADSLMIFYRREHPDFYAAWQNARVMPKFRGSSRSRGEELDPLQAPLAEQSSDATSPEAGASAPDTPSSDATPDTSPLRSTAEGSSPPTNVQNGSPNPSSGIPDTEEAA